MPITSICNNQQKKPIKSISKAMDCRKWLERYSTDCRLKYPSESTQNNYISCVKNFLDYFSKYREPKEVPTQDIKEYLLSFEKLNTRKHNLCAIKSFYRLTVNMPKKIDRVPYPKQEKKLPIVLSVDEVQKMFDVCENLKHRVILALLYSCGLRSSELIKLKWSNIDRSRGIVNIIAAKGKKDRHVPLDINIIPLLEEYYRQYKTQTYILAGQNSEQYTKSSVLQVIRSLGKKANINKRVWTHLMRHNCFTHLFESGVDLGLIKEIAGHSSIKTTLLYTHISHNRISNLKTTLSDIKLKNYAENIHRNRPRR